MYEHDLVENVSHLEFQKMVHLIKGCFHRDLRLLPPHLSVYLHSCVCIGVYIDDGVVNGGDGYGSEAREEVARVPMTSFS